MLYMLENTYKEGLLRGDYHHLQRAEYEMLADQYRRGVLIRIWRKASGEGAVLIVDLPSHEALRDWIKSIPMIDGFGEIKVTPLACNPRFPQMGLPDSEEARARFALVL